MLETNSIVQAAVAQAKSFSGAMTCEYKVETTEPSQFEAGTTFDYSAEITCASPGGQEDETGGIIRVSGRMFSDDPQALKLEIEFVG